MKHRCAQKKAELRHKTGSGSQSTTPEEEFYKIKQEESKLTTKIISSSSSSSSSSSLWYSNINLFIEMIIYKQRYYKSMIWIHLGEPKYHRIIIIIKKYSFKPDVTSHRSLLRFSWSHIENKKEGSAPVWFWLSRTQTKYRKASEFGPTGGSAWAHVGVV